MTPAEPLTAAIPLGVSGVDVLVIAALTPDVEVAQLLAAVGSRKRRGL